MKKYKKILLLIIIFIISLICIFIFFGENISKIRIKSKIINIIKVINKYDEGQYHFKNGVLYDSNNNIRNTDNYIEFEGNFIKDKYGNIEVNLSNDKYIVCKTSLGEITLSNECNIENISSEITRNNSLISFSFNKKIKSYSLNNKDELSNDFIDVTYDEVLSIGFESEGNYYIWFKDEYGNISKPINFDVECLLSDESYYNNKILYCSGSKIIIDDDEWLVINDKNNKMDIMKLDAIDNKLSHYEKEETYKWSTSNINNYLNNQYINTLPNIIKNNIIEMEICDTQSGISGCDSEDGCGGYKKSTIEKNEWECSTYTKSKIRLLSFDEYSSLYKIMQDKYILYDNYWLINTSNNNTSALSILDNGEVYVLEDATTKLKIKPVITISK